MDYALIWSILVGVAVFVYMALDGLDLGVGILFPTARSEEERSHMMNTIAPIWDTNETWLVLAGGGLFGVFPKAYAFIFSSLYVPVIAMLLFLVFRGVSFEFRFKSVHHKGIWNMAFFLGSVGAAAMQGIILGQLVRGFTVVNGGFDGNFFAWMNSFSYLCAMAVILLYAVMGANFLVYRFSGAEQQYFAKLGRIALMVLLAVGAFIVYRVIGECSSAEVAFASQKHWAERFEAFKWIFIGLGVVALLVSGLLFKALSSKKLCDTGPFFIGIVLLAVLVAFVGFLGWPYIVPGVYTIWEASSLPETQRLMFFAALVFLPIILAYSCYNFYVFRGKVKNQVFYH
jgi:cytochrome d ubiquinol oxidase subunit II